MLDKDTKQIIDNACDTLVGKIPSPVSQTEMITTALIYKIMDDMDLESVELGGNKTYFTGDLEDYAFSKIIATKGHQERLSLYLTGLDKLQISKQIPEIFRRVFKEATIPFKDGQTFSLFIEEINCLSYKDSEKIGDAFEYLLDKLGSHGNAGQFRTPRHIIDFIVDIVKPSKDETILDPACGTAGFLISAYKYITNYTKDSLDYIKLAKNIVGFDIDPTMVKLSLVNLFLHKFNEPRIEEYDTISKEKYWDERFDVILANPPFMTPKGGIIPHKRFYIKANRSEVLFVDYFMEHLNYNGRAGFVVPEGIIFNGQSAYKDLRKMMIGDGYLYAVISLPTGVFNPYSGVKTSILLFDREFARKSKDILFIHIDNDGFNLGAQRTPIDKNDLPEAIKIIEKYKNGEDISGYKRALVVSKEKILSESNYDLSAPKYQKKEIVDTKYKMVKLGEVSEFQTGARDKGGALLSGIPSIGGEQISSDGKIKSEKMKYISEAFFSSMKKGILKEKDILLVKDGATIGKVAFYSDLYEKAAVNEHVYIIRSNEKILPFYLFSIIRTEYFQQKLKQYIRGIIGGLSLNIRDIEIPLPPIEVQKEIVAEIENKQSAINHAQEIIRNLERERFYFDRLLEGIEYKEVKLEEVIKTIVPVFKIQSSDFLDNGKFPIIDQSQNFISGYTNDEDKINKISEPVIIFGDHTCALKYIDFDFAQGADGIKILSVKDVVPKYLYYYLQGHPIESSEYKRHFSLLKETIIKIPVDKNNQKKIVEQIDKEQEIIEYNKNLIKIMQDKINKVISRIYKV